MSLFVSRSSSKSLSYQLYQKIFTQPTHYLIAIAIISILNIAYQLNYNSWEIIFDANLWNPTWLLMGPLLLIMRYHREGKERTTAVLFYHLAPFISMMILFIATSYHHFSSSQIADQFHQFYQNLFILVPISLLVYGILACFPLKKKVMELAPFDDLQIVVGGFYLLIAGVSLLMYICWGVLQIDMVIDYRLIIYALLLVMVALIFYYISILNKLEQPGVSESLEDENTLVLNASQVNEYEKKLQHYLVAEQTFLNPNLSLAMLSNQLQIPKYHLSVLFNHHLGKSFYSYLATLRIDYALSELAKNGYNFTVESFAYKCGFNSKTSFHKYFRAYTGLTPIAFINQKSKSK